MAGIYIHIPFCKAKCHYCNFFSLASLKYKNEFLNSLHQEIQLKKDSLKDTVHSIYFGGGTPSILQGSELHAILLLLGQHYTISQNIEITLEANPEDIHLSNLKYWNAIGVNRLSIGVQSLNDELLIKLNRNHTALQALNAVKLAQDLGFENLSTDFIFGIPGQNSALLAEDLLKMVNLNVDHISAYNLTVEDKTALDVLIRQKKYPSLNEEQGVEQFYLVEEILESNSFEHYEISNYARSNKYSFHNTNYWNRSNYIGFGPSAHSFINGKRSWNISSLNGYIKQIAESNFYVDQELINKPTAFNEYVMLSLRTSWGIDIKIIENEFSGFAANLLAKAEIEKSKGNLVIEGDKIKLTRKGKIFADGIASLFFA